eukprot:2219939-Rhodomonas_salina.2
MQRDCLQIADPTPHFICKTLGPRARIEEDRALLPVLFAVGQPCLRGSRARQTRLPIEEEKASEEEEGEEEEEEEEEEAGPKGAKRQRTGRGRQQGEVAGEWEEEEEEGEEEEDEEAEGERAQIVAAEFRALMRAAEESELCELEVPISGDEAEEEEVQEE